MSATHTVRGRAGGHAFIRHAGEMTAAMMVGMVASAAVFLSVAGTTVDGALREHAVLFVCIQAVGMTVAMVAWMRLRGHAWRRCVEMGAAMVAPAVPLVSLRASGAVGGSVCGVYCIATFAAMILVLLHRRGDFGEASTLA